MTDYGENYARIKRHGELIAKVTLGAAIGVAVAFIAIGLPLYFGLNEATNDYAGMDFDEAERYSALDFVEEYGWQIIDPSHGLRTRQEMPDYEKITPTHMGKDEVWAVQYPLRDGKVCIMLWDKPSNMLGRRQQYQAVPGRCP